MSTNHKELVNKLELKIKQLEAQLDRSHQAFVNIIEKNRDGILIFDESGKIIYANAASFDLFGKNLGSLLGENIGIFIDQTQKTEITIIHKDRGPIIIEVNIGDTTWNNKPAKIASLRDITEHNKTKHILEKLSQFDYLTDLVNRVYFEKTLKKRLTLAEKNQKKIALFFLDMDGFKNVNDTFGHPIGDKLLVHAATLLKSCVRLDDVVSRLGGDEFSIIIEHAEQKKYYEQVANRILAMINQPIVIHNHEIHVSFSIGIAVYPDDAKTMDELIKNADSAMYLAKNRGRNQFYFYDPIQCE